MRFLLGLFFVCAAEGADIAGTDLLDGNFVAALRAAVGQDVADFAGTLPARRAFTEGRAAAAILTRESIARARGLRPLARIVSYASHAQEPEWFTTAPAGAIRKALKLAVVNATFDLFDKLGATEEQLDFPVVYASALNGYAGLEPTVRSGDMTPLFEAFVKHV